MRIPTRLMRVLLALGMLTALPAVARAQCTISTTGVSFGNYDVFNAAPTDTTGSVTYNCLLGIPVQINLTKGSAASFTPRTMTKGAETFAYNLYLDAARSTVWGDGTGGTSVYTRSLSLLDINSNIIVTIYGRIPARQDVSAGAYTDTVTAVINF